MALRKATVADIVAAGGNVTVNAPKGAPLSTVTVGKGKWRESKSGPQRHTFSTWNGLVSVSVYLPTGSDLVSRVEAYAFDIDLADDIFGEHAEYVGSGKANKDLPMISHKAKPPKAPSATSITIDDIGESITF